MVTRVLFLCTGNSARSQMAEHLLRHLAGDGIEVYSAGTAPAGVNPLTIKVLDELEIDATNATSKKLDIFLGESFDYIITVCDNAEEHCPIFPGGGKRLHWSFDDPAAAEGDEQARLECFRRVRDEIRSRLEEWEM